MNLKNHILMIVTLIFLSGCANMLTGCVGLSEQDKREMMQTLEIAKEAKIMAQEALDTSRRSDALAKQAIGSASQASENVNKAQNLVNRAANDAQKAAETALQAAEKADRVLRTSHEK